MQPSPTGVVSATGQPVMVPTPTIGSGTTEAHKTVTETGQLAQGSEMSNRVKVSYEVKRGDTLASIARLYKTTVASLKTWNPRLEGRQLNAGDHLTLYRLAN